MKYRIENMEKQVSVFFKKNGKFMLSGFFIGILAYFMMMALNLVNDIDGIWHLSNFIAGDWEISLGRGLQRYADRARFGIVSDSFNTMLTLFLVSVANTMIISRLFPEGGFCKSLILTVLTVNPVVCCSLTYSYMSVNFGLAYFFSTLAFYGIKTAKSRKKILPEGAICGLYLGISMAFYQAYICVTVTLMLVFVLKSLCERKELKEVLRYTISGIIIVAGGV
ncbi:MAG: glucosyltransferase domain-containing protein [bacterium]|nr:glucosyltransferase domain-containing protein [bacterium]